MIFSENFLSVEIFLEWKWAFKDTLVACVAGPQFYGGLICSGQDFGGHGGGIDPMPAKILPAANHPPPLKLRAN